MTFLSEQQKQQFIDYGYTVVSGLVSPEVISDTREKLCDALGIVLDDPATWPDNARAVSLDTVGLTEACFTTELNSAAHELVGDMLWSYQCISSVLDRRGDDPYVKGFIPVLAYPREGEKEFSAPWPGGFHVDGIQFATLLPDKMLLVALLYLTDTTEYGGATAVIPGSHRQIFEHWMERGETPSHEVLMSGVENPQPMPVAGRAGDVIFMHHLLAHSGSANRDNHVRVALNANLTSRPEKEYEAKSGAPQDNWTPLDWTLRTDNIAVPSGISL